MRVYATRDDNQKRVLVAIKCDKCDAEIKPNPDISNSGWTTQGVYYGPGDDRNSQWDLCPMHSIGVEK